MESLQKLIIPRLFPFFFFFIIIINLQPSLPFSPTDHYLLNCGSHANTILDNREFIADTSIPRSIIKLSTNPKISVQDRTNQSPLYSTARVFTSPSRYEFQIKKLGTHLVRLHFSPFNSAKFNLFDAQFGVSVNGFTLLSNLDLKSNSSNSVDLKEFLIWVDGGRALVVLFSPSKGSFGYVNAIEIISAPDDLIGDTARFVGSDGIGDFKLVTRQALESVYRINVGGALVTPFNDSLWRTWIPDDGFLKLESAAKRVSFSGQIKYRLGGASREVAPDNVYNSARVFNDSNVSSSNFNVTWVLPVKSGCRYLVRMHFCDIASKALNLLYFNVYINGYLAYEDLDLSELTDRLLASPFYADFVVDAGTSTALDVSIGGSSLSSPDRINGILNGLEVWKLNSTIYSLSETVSVDSVQDQHSGKIGLFMPAVAIMSFLVAASLFMRRRFKLKDSLAWSSEGGSKHENQPLVR
ncbi:hypothetical protein Scep_025942 [Stephania cephalantha]|uniref:Malectin-like domain-containing protein n=1 Tax=Stephania cephalantha TaxID=152367 RepID=A0AAP0EPS6_9MAGN